MTNRIEEMKSAFLLISGIHADGFDATSSAENLELTVFEELTHNGADQFAVLGVLLSLNQLGTIQNEQALLQQQQQKKKKFH